jgi:hypothetical protein
MLIGLWRFLLHLSVWRILSGTKSLVEMREERWVWGDKKLVMCEKSYRKLNISAKVIFLGVEHFMALFLAWKFWQTNTLQLTVVFLYA